MGDGGDGPVVRETTSFRSRRCNSLNDLTMENAGLVVYAEFTGMWAQCMTSSQKETKQSTVFGIRFTHSCGYVLCCLEMQTTERRKDSEPRILSHPRR